VTDPRRLLDDPGALAELEQRVLTVGRDAQPSDDFARELWSSLSAQLPPGGGDPGGSPGSDGGLGGAGGAGLGAAGGSAAGSGAATGAALGAKTIVASIVKSSLVGAVLGAAVMTGAPLVTGGPPALRSDETALGTAPAGAERASSERRSAPGSEAPAPALEGELAQAVEPGAAPPPPEAAREVENPANVARAPGATDRQPLDPANAGRAAPSVAAFSNAPGPAPAATPPSQPATDGAREESRLVAGARRALRSGDSRAALDLLDRTTQKFPAGVLAQEREALAIEALVSSGRRDAARSRAAAFLQAFPSSPHAARVRALVSP
jgi:hypothetical protein